MTRGFDPVFGVKCKLGIGGVNAIGLAAKGVEVPFHWTWWYVTTSYSQYVKAVDGRFVILS